MQTKPNILLIYTGGTIGMIKDFETGVLKAFNFKKLLQKIPELKQRITKIIATKLGVNLGFDL